MSGAHYQLKGRTAVITDSAKPVLGVRKFGIRP